MSNSFAAPWTVACQAPLFLGFFRQKYWSGLPFPSPEDLLYPGIKPESLALAGRFFTAEPPGKPIQSRRVIPKGGDICTCMADSFCCAAGANTAAIILQ